MARLQRAQLHLGAARPYGCTNEQMKVAEKALEGALDDAPDVPYQRIVDEIVAALRDLIAAEREKTRRREAQEHERERWLRSSVSEFESRWEKDAAHEEWKLRDADYDEKSDLRRALGDVKARAVERFERAIKPRPTGDNVDELIDKIIAEVFEDALGEEEEEEPDTEDDR